jgi:hypothetical protein
MRMPTLRHSAACRRFRQAGSHGPVSRSLPQIRPSTFRIANPWRPRDSTVSAAVDSWHFIPTRCGRRSAVLTSAQVVQNPKFPILTSRNARCLDGPPGGFRRPCGTRFLVFVRVPGVETPAYFQRSLRDWNLFRRRELIPPCVGMTVCVRELFFRPAGARASAVSHPRLAPWAALLRRLAASSALMMA